jgi:hypothetical protein
MADLNLLDAEIKKLEQLKDAKMRLLSVEKDINTSILYSTGVRKKYSDALSEVRNTSNPAYRVNAERKLNLAAEQAVAFYDDIHHNRNIAFSTVGSGYADFNNYRWQAGKRSGVIQALRSIKEHKDAIDTETQKQTYGVELPDAATLIRRTLRG